MIYRIVAGFVGLLDIANGSRMILAPANWYAVTPGVSDTGPYNFHFVVDIGLAYLVGGIALGAFAARPELRLAAIGASGFLLLHGLFHIVLAASGHSHRPGIDLGVAALAAAGVAACLAWREKAA